MDPKLGFSSFFHDCIISFPDIAQDCSLVQCLTSSRAETSKKCFCAPNRDQNYLFHSNVVERPLKLSCFNFSLPVDVILCQSLYHSFSFVVTCCNTRRHSFSFTFPLINILLHSLSLHVPLVCLINDPFS